MWGAFRMTGVGRWYPHFCMDGCGCHTVRCVCFSQGPLCSGAGESEGTEERASQPVRSLSQTSPFFEPQMGPVKLRAQHVMPGRRRAGCDWTAVSRGLEVSGQHQGGSWVMLCKAGQVLAPSLPAAPPTWPDGTQACPGRVVQGEGDEEARHGPVDSLQKLRVPVASGEAEAMAGCLAWGWPLWTAEVFVAKPFCSWVVVGPLLGGHMPVCVEQVSESNRFLAFYF